MASEQDVDMLVMENELIKRDMKDMEDRVKAEIAHAFAGLKDFFGKRTIGTRTRKWTKQQWKWRGGDEWTGGETGGDAGASEP